MKTTSIVALVAGFVLTVTPDARAQAQTGRMAFVSINAGGQAQTRTFRDSSNFSLFGETALVAGNQTVNGGFVFDASAGYRVWRNLYLALGVSAFRVRGDAAIAASIPNALRPGRPTTFTAEALGLRQTDVSLNMQALWEMPINDRIDLSIFLGPSLVHVSQEFATATPASGVERAAVVTQSANTGKAGTGGVDLRYKLTNRTGLGVFVRYAGGEVDLPLIEKLKVGGVQAGGGLRFRF